MFLSIQFHRCQFKWLHANIVKTKVGFVAVIAIIKRKRLWPFHPFVSFVLYNILYVLYFYWAYTGRHWFNPNGYQAWFVCLNGCFPSWQRKYLLFRRIEFNRFIWRIAHPPLFDRGIFNAFLITFPKRPIDLKKNAYADEFHSPGIKV